ncbi:MAG: HIT family protein [Candidatus Marinimicrobia bacterium]|nr:HIT family protein [Candidatus Neomarinimicrobiota bacterium]
MDCIFCKKSSEAVVENEMAYAIFDEYPVNKGHMLIIPKRHFDNYFDATKKEYLAIQDLSHECKNIIDEKYSPDGYNIGVNIGYEAGQTIMHLHIHLIPRYKGDIEDPRGGVRKIKEQLVEYKG